MQSFPPTIILRHQRENLKKCSLSGLELREDMQFFTYPNGSLPDLSRHVMLVMEDAPELSISDAPCGIFLLDSTWRYVDKMRHFAEKDRILEKRTLPSRFRTAYPRRQEDCIDPSRGLSSIEALYISYLILNRNTCGLLKNYYWKNQFLNINQLPFDF